MIVQFYAIEPSIRWLPLALFRNAGLGRFFESFPDKVRHFCGKPTLAHCKRIALENHEFVIFALTGLYAADMLQFEWRQLNNGKQLRVLRPLCIREIYQQQCNTVLRNLDIHCCGPFFCLLLCCEPSLNLFDLSGDWY